LSSRAKAREMCLDRYRECNGDFVLVPAVWSSCLESNGRDKLVEIVNDALVEGRAGIAAGVADWGRRRRGGASLR